MELQRDAIQAMLRAAYNTGMETADQVKPAGARRQLREDWLDSVISKLGGSPLAPTDDLAVQLDNLRQFVLFMQGVVRPAPNRVMSAVNAEWSSLIAPVERDAKRVQR